MTRASRNVTPLNAPPARRTPGAASRRLADHVAAVSPEYLSDPELLEILLRGAVPAREARRTSAALTARLGSLWEVITASRERLLGVPGVSEAAAARVATFNAVALRMQRRQIANRPVLSRFPLLVEYCQAQMANQRAEQLRLLALNGAHALIANELQHVGTINHTPAYPREIVRRALQLDAASIILVHNHPSGDPTPSQEDIRMTRAVAQACAPVGVRLFDHLIVTAKGYTSFRELGLV